MLSLLSTIPNVLYYIHIYSLGIDLQDRTKKGREERNSMHPSSCTQRQLRRDKYTLNHHKKCEIIGYYCKAVWPPAHPTGTEEERWEGMCTQGRYLTHLQRNSFTVTVLSFNQFSQLLREQIYIIIFFHCTLRSLNYIFIISWLRVKVFIFPNVYTHIYIFIL